MNRREFLKAAGLATASLLMPKLSVWAAAPGTAAAGPTNKLVVVFLRGAVDGLSVVVPYSDPTYYKVRNNIAIAPPGNEL
ncbi:MAG TPA: twin-arginine translocation signal domain-containing protein, partial [Candidatus Melainabacteria bacterium]|nr:twin-arginine translocation signal domain-containing protein [Candidatus Melainabacteria bacterium]